MNTATSDRPADRRPRMAEAAGLLCILATTALMLSFSHSIRGWSDPAHWYGFGLSFPRAFGSSRLACGFPFLIWVASQLVGPLRAFLVNIPILVGLVACLYGFCKTVLPAEWTPGRRVYGSLLALLMLVHVNRDMLVYLVNPYRDPASFLFLLISCAAVIRMVRSRRRRLAWAAAGGLALAASVTCRETSGLAIVAMGLYVLLARCRDRRMPVVIPALVFLGTLLIGMVPWLMQNVLVTGNMAVPAQLEADVAGAGSMTALLPQSRMARMLPRTLSYLGNHYGGVLCTLLAVGLLGALRKRRLALLGLCAGAGVIFLLFYAHYHKVVARYLLVLDWFTIPLMACGASCLLEWGWRKARRAPVPAFALSYVLLVLTLLRIALPLPEGDRITLRHVRAFGRDVQAVLPDRAPVLCERPLTGLLSCFTAASPRTLRYLGRRRRLHDPHIWRRLDALLQREGDLYVAVYSEAYDSFVRREYDLVDRHRFDASAYNMTPIFQAESFHVSRLARWRTTGRTTVRVPVPPTEAGTILEVDVGKLSAYDRRAARVLVDGVTVDEHPLDNVNFYPVQGADHGVLRTELVSDGPLPRTFDVSARSALDPIDMNVNEANIVWYRNRFSASWLEKPFARYPGIREEGTILVPTPFEGHRALDVRLRVTWKEADADGWLTVTSGGADPAVGRQRLRAGQGWHFLTFRLGADRIEGLNTRLTLRVRSDGESRGILYLRQVRVGPAAARAESAQGEAGHGRRAATLRGGA